MKKVIRFLQFVLILIGIYGVYGLVEQEMAVGNICPPVFGISACYIMAGCLIAIVLSFLGRKWHALFSLGASIAWCLSATGSYYQYKGIADCPMAANDVPMCYISLGLFSLLLILDFIHGKIKK